MPVSACLVSGGMRVYAVVYGRGVAVAVGYVVRRWRSWPCGVVCQSWCVVAQVCDVECGWLNFGFLIFLIEKILVKPLFGI